MRGFVPLGDTASNSCRSSVRPEGACVCLAGLNQEGRDGDFSRRMTDAVGGDDPGGDGLEGRIGLIGEDRMHHDADGFRKSGRLEMPCGLDHRPSGRDDVIDQDRLPSGPIGEARRRDFDITVSVACLGKK